MNQNIDDEYGTAVVGKGRGKELTDYDPDKGLNTITVAEAAVRRFAKAKDPEGLRHALETKLREQRKFVLWWDEQEKQHGQLGDRTPTQFTRLDDLGIDKETVYRWRKRLKDSKHFDAEFEKAAERWVKIAEFRQGGGESFPRSLNSGENEWYTPPDCLAAARDVLGSIDLDPASSARAQKHVRAKRYYDKSASGLEQEWGGRVWLNPPYAQPHLASSAAKAVA